MAVPAVGQWEPYESRGSCTVVRPGKADAFSRRQTCQGRSQKPCSLDSKVKRDRHFEAYRRTFFWKDANHQAVVKANVEVASKVNVSGSRDRNRESEGSMNHRNLTDAMEHPGGVVTTA